MTKKNKLKIITGAVLGALAITALLFALAKRESENLEPLSPSEAVNVPDGERMIILENEEYEKNAMLRSSGICIPFELVEEKFGAVFYRDEDENDTSLTYCVPGRIVRLFPDKPYYLENGVTVETSEPVLFSNDNGLYVLLSFVEPFCKMEYELYDSPDRMIFHYLTGNYLVNRTVDETPVHAAPGLSSGVIMTLPSDTGLQYIGGYGNRRKDFIKVMTNDGIYGYVQRKHVTESVFRAYAGIEKENVEIHKLEDKKIRLGWFYVGSEAANSGFDEVAEMAKGMNVLSPTWFSLCDEEGNIVSRGSRTVVEKAHSLGMKVWVMVDFPDGEVSPHNNLSKNSSRDALIRNLIDETLELGADGINVDFEALSEKTGVHFVEFIRELSVYCHMNDLVLSVDNLVPEPSREHYDIATQAVFADYVILMTYDEHYAKSEAAGSVASLPFVRKAVSDTAKLMDRSRLIMGIPFYTRLWKTENNELSSQVLSIYRSVNDAEDGLYGTAKFDGNAAQNYYEYTEDKAKYMIWMEDEISVGYKMAEAVSQQLGGIACWRLGLETDSIWDIINLYWKDE